MQKYNWEAIFSSYALYCKKGQIYGQNEEQKFKIVNNANNASSAVTS